ncbi:hypothetical protein Y032_0120g908 [Ancylostoma ceylanicum]|uniref:Uncharacterized protein n=1 Tax=Ancylostoma ceylanicum TaxID=53326 RepID=A0A016TAP5_9BILA|nr:hypothetical protein Y032_0120g908 [Ancylostoma ceylanicum]
MQLFFITTYIQSLKAASVEFLALEVSPNVGVFGDGKPIGRDETAWKKRGMQEIKALFSLCRRRERVLRRAVRARPSTKPCEWYASLRQNTHRYSVNWLVGPLKARRGRNNSSCFSACQSSFLVFFPHM